MTHDRPSMHALKKAGLPTFTMQPVAGYYELRDDDNRWVGVEIWFGAPLDPVTGEMLDRSHRWCALIDGNTLVSADDVWVNCCARPITAEMYAALLKGDHVGEVVTRINFLSSV